MKRWLVVFRSEPSPTGKVDATAVGVWAEGQLAAIAIALKDARPQHPWGLASAVPWTRGTKVADVAAIA